MPSYEVYVPAAPPRSPADVTLRVECENWLAALKAGLQKMSGPQLANNILCDVLADGAIDVTDPVSGRVFRIRALDREPSSGEPTPGAFARPGASRRPSAAADRVEEVAAPGAPPPARIGRGAGRASVEELLADVFHRAAAMPAAQGREQGLGFLLDLAMEAIGAEAGSVLLSDLDKGDLRFAVARGPKGADLMRLGITVPMGVGLVGFCAQENVCVAVSDVEKDPRFYRGVAQAIGYATRSLLCAPIASGGRVHGGMEVLNKAQGRPFDQADIAVLSYLAHRAAEIIEPGER